MHHIAAALLIALALPAAAEERTPEDPRLHQTGQLTVATGDPVFPPWMLNNAPESGEGFENGLVYALAAEMGFAPDQVAWVRQTFEQTIAPGQKAYDFAIQQVSVTEARSEFLTFSRVYFQPDKAVVALPGSPVAEAASFDDLRAARWGVTIGTTDHEYLMNILGIGDAAVYDDQIGVFQAMQARQIDATVVALPTALFVTAVQVPEAEIAALLPADANDLGHGLVFELGNPLVEWVDEALGVLIERGVVDELVERYLVADPDLRMIAE